MKNTFKTRMAASMIALTAFTGIGLATAGSAAAVPQPTIGRACPAGDSDLIRGGILVKKWNFVRNEGASACGYKVRICNNAWLASCTDAGYAIIQKVRR